MATGMLVIGIGRATRLLGHLAAHDKEYIAVMRLGQATETDDAQGELTSQAPADHITDDQILEVIRGFRGHIQQRPSKVSAIKVDGKRAYARVRAGEDIELPAREVTVQDIEIIEINRDSQLHVIDVSVRVVCSAGTYIRALARDIGEQLGVGGHLTLLRRTRSGLFSAMTPLETLKEHPAMVSLEEALRTAFPVVTLNDEDADKARHGRTVTAPLKAEEGLSGIFDEAGNPISLATIEDNKVVPMVVFVGAE
jgi:tRNA pseudouridine55 synthase